MACAQEYGKFELQFTGDLVPNLVEKRAGLNSDAIYLEYPVSALNFDDDYREATNGDFKNAVNGAARWLQTRLGPGKDFETLAYMGSDELGYSALMLSAVRAVGVPRSFHAYIPCIQPCFH